MGKSDVSKKEPSITSSGRSRQVSLTAESYATSEEDVFPVDGQLMMVLPRAGASLNNPDVQLPILRSDEGGVLFRDAG